MEAKRYTSESGRQKKSPKKRVYGVVLQESYEQKVGDGYSPSVMNAIRNKLIKIRGLLPPFL